ncbi:MAG TPA: hypothetical protein VMZ30_07030 [Pyrinomonadaceae bacterium]|nr:hypothetical protein [Pyrinomonadaceae bacterium]
MYKHLGVRKWLIGRLGEVRIHAALALVILITFVLSQPRTTLVVGGILCFVTYGYLGFREARKTPLWLSPLSFYFFWYCVGMGASPFYIGLITSDDSVRFVSDSTMVPIADLAAGYVVFLCGSLALHLGVQIFRPISPSQETEGLGKNFLKLLGAVWVVGLIFQINPSLFSFLGGTAKILAVALLGSVCGFAIVERQRMGLSRLGFFTILLLGTTGLFFGNLASDSKTYIMFSFLPLFWFFLIRRRLRVWVPPLALVLGLFYLATVAPVIQTARMRPVEVGTSTREHLIETFDNWRRETPAEISGSFLGDQLDRFFQRQFDAVPVGFLVGEVERSGLMLGETMKYAGYAFVPRLIWPDKPTVTRGGWFSTYLGLYDVEAEATTAIGMTAVGELYWNFGILGVLIGMCLMGCGLGYLWSLATADPRAKPIHMLLYVTVMLAMPDMAEAVTIFVSLVVAFLTFKAAFFFMDVLSLVGRKTGALTPTSPIRTRQSS